MTTKKSKSKKGATKAKTTTTKGSRGSSASKDPLPSKIYANVSPRSLGGVSMFEAQDQIHAATVANFFSQQDVIEAAVRRLQEAGFDILQIGPMTINIAGSAAPETTFLSIRELRKMFANYSRVSFHKENCDELMLRGRVLSERKTLLPSLGKLWGLDIYIEAQK